MSYFLYFRFVEIVLTHVVWKLELALKTIDRRMSILICDETKANNSWIFFYISV